MNLDSSVTTDLTAPPVDNQDRMQRKQQIEGEERTRERSILGRIALLEPIWLAMLAPAILMPGRFWPTSLQPLFVLGLFVFWPLRRIAYRRWSAPTPLAWPVGLLMAWTPVTLWAAADRSKAWVAIGYLLLGVALYWALINWPPARKRPIWTVLMLAAVGVGLAVVGPQLMDVRQGSQLFRIPALYARIGLLAALVGESMNGNVLAGGLVVVVPAVAALAVEPRWSRRYWGPILAGLVAAGGLLPLFLTQSRGALLAALLALLVLFILRWPKLVWTLPLVAAAVGLVILRMGVGGLLDALSSDTSLVGLSGRLEIWNRSLLALQDFLWTGIGHGQFLPIVPTLYPFFTTPTDIPHAHNLFLQVGVDMGLVGLIGFGATVVISLVVAGRSMRHARKRQYQVRFGGRRWQRYALTWVLAAGAISALTGMLLHGLVDAVLWNTKLAFLPWIIFAQASLTAVPVRRLKRGGRRG